MLTGVALEAASALASFERPWHFAGGWAIDLHLGRLRRDHKDADIAIDRIDQHSLRRALANVPLYVLRKREFYLWEGEPIEEPQFQIFADPGSDRSYLWEFLLEERSEESWLYRRDRRVHMPLDRALRETVDGIPYLAPEIVLLFKSKTRAETDALDFQDAAPTLTAGARQWLYSAIQGADSGHPWLASLLGPTPFAELNDLLSELNRRIRDALAENLVGFYLQGSFAVGDFDQFSDVDFVAVLDRELTDADVRGLNALHAEVFATETEWAKHLEGSYFTRDELEGKAGAPVWYLEHGEEALTSSNHCNTLVVRWTLERYGTHLYGPPIETVVARVNRQDLIAEVVNTMVSWGFEILASPGTYANRFYQGFIALSYCRMLHTVASGGVYSKRAGSEWAKLCLPDRWHGLIDRSWSTRSDPGLSSRTPADPADFGATLDFVRFAISQVGSPG